jgi:hypothetical protein
VSLEILQIVPRLPPSINGVGDYAYLLAKQLRSTHTINTRFLVCDPDWECQSEIEGFKIEKLQVRQAAELMETLSGKMAAQVTLLHYVGYGYEKRGCPVWLKEGLELWRRSNAGCRLIIMFHELYAFGAPWRSSFWLSYSQQRLVIHLARLADSCITNLRRYAEWVGNRAKRHCHKIISMPVFSNVGELANCTPLDTRPPNMIIFGGARWVRELLDKHLTETQRCYKAFGIEKIVTVGSPIGTAPKNLPIPVEEHGFLDASQVAEVIKSSRIGMMNYFPGYLAKSGVYAAYAALGVVPVLPQFNPSTLDGCIEGETYLSAKRITNQPSDKFLQRIASNARDWYEQHNLARTADAYAKLLKENGKVTC